MNVLRLLIWSIMAVVAWYVLGRARVAGSEYLSMFLGVLACLCGIVVLGWRGRTGSSVRYGARARWFRMAIWFCLVVLVLFWVGLATRGPVREMVVVWEDAFDPGSIPEAIDESPKEETTGHMDWNEGSRRALPRQTNIKPAKTPEVFLRIEDRGEAVRMSRGPIYLSSIAYDQYEDSAWQVASESPRDLPADSGGVITLESLERGKGIWHTIVMSADAKRQSPLVALQGVLRVEGLKSLERWSPALHVLPHLEDPQKGYRYRAYSRPLTLNEIPESESGEGESHRDPSWLRMPQDELGKRITTLAESVATGHSLAEKARRLQAHLRNNYRYSLSTANAQDLDPLDNFLFGEKSGHCEYFATAGALMARAVGIPSRVMYGWAGGTWYEHADWFVFRADEAHVWVEVWLGSRGWVVMDPTPPEVLRTHANNTSSDKLPLLPGVALEEEILGEELSDSESNMPWVVMAVIAVVGLAVLLWPSARAMDAEDQRIIPEPWRERVAMHYLEEWRKAAMSRLPLRLVGSSTLRQQMRTIHPEPEFGDELLRYHYCVRYEGQPRDRVRERKLKRRIRAWAAELRE